MASDNLDFQVAAFLIQNPSLYSSLLSRLEIPFGSKMVRGVWSILRSTWKKHGEFPTREGCMELLANHPKVDSRPEILRMLNEAVCEIYDLSAQGSATKEVILSRILDNYKWQLKEQLDSMGLDNITDKVLELSQEVHKLESFLKGGEEDWIFPLSTAHLENPLELLFNLQGDPIPTGIAPLDEWMNGGPRRKESMMVIGITDQGKSMLVNSFAGDNIRQGCRSAVYILDSPEADVFSKFWANFSGVGIEDNKVASEFSTRLMRNVREEWRGQLACRVWTRGTKTIDDVRRDLDALTKYYYKKDVAAGMDPGEAGVIDTVYIDHMECLAPKGKAKEDWLNSGGLADGIDQIAKDYNVFVMAPTQAKQGATRLDIVDMTEASRAWGKNHPMTHVVGLCRSASEVHQGIGRLYMAKSKRTRSHYIVPVRMDRHTQRVYENGPVYYPEFGGGTKEGEKKPVRGKPVDTSKPPTRDFPEKYTNGKQKVKKGCEEEDKDPGLFQ